MTESAPSTPPPPPDATPQPSAPPGEVPLMDPTRIYEDWGPQAEEAVRAVLRSHTYVRGPHVSGLEASFGTYVGTARAVAVDSCTDALFLVLRAVLETRPAERREVILPSFTFFATAGAVVNAGGVPRFADVDPHTHNLDLASVERLLSPATAAVIPVHLFGSPADLPGLRALVGEDVFLLEDAAQAIHAELGSRRVGALGDAAVFSFYPSKNLGAAGDGGIVTTNDEALADAVVSLRAHGAVERLADHTRVGTNSRMDEIQAAVLRVKLPFVDRWTRERRAIAARYDLAFQGTAVQPQRPLPGAASAYHLYTVRVPGRDAVRAALADRGIHTGVYYARPLHTMSCFAHLDPAPCPQADALAAGVLSLPCFPGLTRGEQDRVIATVREVVA